MSLPRTIRVTVAGSDDLRAYVQDELDLLYGPSSASVTVTSGDQDTARAQGWSTCEEDDADADIGDHVLSMLGELRYEHGLTMSEE